MAIIGNFQHGNETIPIAETPEHRKKTNGYRVFAP